MLVDMHLHECTYSTDSFLHLEEIVSIARQKGLDAICITDHDSMGLRERAEAYSREIGYPIFVGVEFFSLWGDITAWGIDGIPDQRVSAQDFIDLVREKDGFCVSCHPFRSNNRGLREHLRDVHGLDGVEVLNGSTPLEENRTALRFCRELGLKAIGASDAHVPEQVGKYVTWLPETVTTSGRVSSTYSICELSILTMPRSSTACCSTSVMSMLFIFLVVSETFSACISLRLSLCLLTSAVSCVSCIWQ